MTSTIIVAMLLMGLVAICLGIGWILTGKVKLRRGCGSLPKEREDEKGCSLCGSEKKCKNEKK